MRRLFTLLAVQQVRRIEWTLTVDFLNEWPQGRRDLIHEAALKACYDAFDGRKPVSAARNSFFGFAQRPPYWRMQPPPCNGSCLQVGSGKERAYRDSW
ncbi:DUF982 domain-containing protein [Mesorhizobium sp. M1E.F.Ca.ET.041.01.1.1]|uniref:DUF982 domain-containing protein n=1 Tax=Mesorhizobium sp. M1E.F.Ca.ET.041.01.1.1 TaxID=2496759 RepID=UPI001FDEAFB9|nr:DUF982 domain-containing protein [Mesorhizobium sp. M1E.F.Ca.ET.041.01.1.1]